LETLGNFPIWPFLDHTQDEQFALWVRKVRERLKDSRGKRQAVVDGLEIGVHERDRETQALPSAVLHPSFAQGRPKDIVSDSVEPRQCGPFVLVSEPPSAMPCLRKDLGGQIGAIVGHPDTRPRENLAYVSVVELGKGVRIVQRQ
jgi:hypothetical protein